MHLLVSRGDACVRSIVSRAFIGLTLVATLSACGSGETEDSAYNTSGGSQVITGVGGGGTGGAPPTSIIGSSGNGSGDGGSPTAMGKGPPYPIVLAHGFFGFEGFAGQDYLTYFYKVKPRLEADGEIVITPSVDPFNDSEYRSEQLLAKIEAFLKETGYAKVNIVGHSQGGLDGRAVAHKRPDLVASVVTVATPHYGSPVADVAVKLLGDPNASAIADALTKLIGAPLYDQIGSETSVMKPLHLFSKPGITAFNTKYTDGKGVFYASLAGRSALHGFDEDCKAEISLPFIKSFQGTIDPLTALFAAGSPVMAGYAKGYAHDGLVRAKDAHWGEFWGCVPADHIDEIGQIFGASPGLGNDWKYVEFYPALVAYIHKRGF
jgi:triacylglycerol lipase